MNAKGAPVAVWSNGADLSSAAGQMQVEMYQRGTSGQLELYPFDIRRFLVWPAPESFQKELRRIHDKAASADA